MSGLTDEEMERRRVYHEAHLWADQYGPVIERDAKNMVRELAFSVVSGLDHYPFVITAYSYALPKGYNVRIRLEYDKE